MNAILSPCQQHRFRLERKVGETGKLYAFVGINPSTADATENDATVRKMIGFTQRWGGRGFLLGNLYSLRATDVRDLAGAYVNMSPASNHLLQIFHEADVIVPCWGSLTKIPNYLRGRAGTVTNMIRESGKPAFCLGYTKSGDPKHPLMLGYNTPLVPFKEAQAK